MPRRLRTCVGSSASSGRAARHRCAPRGCRRWLVDRRADRSRSALMPLRTFVTASHGYCEVFRQRRSCTITLVQLYSQKVRPGGFLVCYRPLARILNCFALPARCRTYCDERDAAAVQLILDHCKNTARANQNERIAVLYGLQPHSAACQGSAARRIGGTQ